LEFVKNSQLVKTLVYCQEMIFKKSFSYKFVAFAVLVQSFLVILQQVLIAVFHMEQESTTIYRVMLTAIPLSIAIIMTLFRKWKVFVVVYSITLLIVLLNILIFHQNEIFLVQNSLRFLLPVVIPSALCLMFIPSIDIVEDVLYKISWLCTFPVFIYVINFFTGTFIISDYNMSFSYGLLLPMLSLYSKKNPCSVIVSIILFIIVVGIGSRGAAVIFVLYALYDIFQSHKKFAIPALLLLIVFFLFLPSLAQWFESIDIHSRTLNLLFDHNLLRSDARSLLYESMLDVFWDNPITGIGLFGDRIYLNGSYVHNFIIELYLNWGVLIGTIILLFLLVKFIKTYKNSNKTNRNILIKYLLASVVPLMFSGSYLIDYNLGIFIGVLFLLSRTNRDKSFQTAI